MKRWSSLREGGNALFEQATIHILSGRAIVCAFNLAYYDDMFKFRVYVGQTVDASPALSSKTIKLHTFSEKVSNVENKLLREIERGEQGRLCLVSEEIPIKNLQDGARIAPDKLTLRFAFLY